MPPKPHKNGHTKETAKVHRRSIIDVIREHTDVEEPRFFNRDLSWLEFNRRVLAQAEDQAVPLLDRVRFLVIFTSNLDEFFMKRVAMLRRLVNTNDQRTGPDGLKPRDHLSAVRASVLELQEHQARIYQQQLLPALLAANIAPVEYTTLSERDQRWIDEWYRVNVFPALTPLAVDPSHRFPFISNLSHNIAIMGYLDGQTRDLHLARVKVPSNIKRFVELPGASGQPRRFVGLADIIANNLDNIFPGVHIKDQLHFRVTRSSGLQYDDKNAREQDVLESIENELKQRRFAKAIRLECHSDPSPHLLRQLVDKLNLDPADVYERSGPIDYLALADIADLDMPALKTPRYKPAPSARLTPDKGRDIFGCIRKQDILLHHPYESFEHSVERFIAEAAADPDVLTIKQTLYRTSPDSPFIASLVRAAESGKQVACLVEVRARFDEQRNVKFVRQLQRAGVHVAYGVLGLKTHSKISLVVRKEKHGLRCYAHIGTGNYHPKTAQLYTDLGLLTCDPILTGDLVNLFNYLTGLGIAQKYDSLLIAPFNMRSRFNELIDQEIEFAKAKRAALAANSPGAANLPGGRIVAKINSMEDQKIAARLYEASQAGVEVILIVRGFCCIRPGVPGMSENIKVRSVVGRFLEHSRLFHFGSGQTDPLEGEWFIGSADWMYRNLNDRVECITPVRDPVARGRLQHVVDVMLADRRNAWDLTPDGSYTRAVPPADADPNSAAALGTFETLMRHAQGKV
jgi:polyphosphate kinase